MSTLVRLAHSRGHVPFDESPRVALKVFGARLVLFVVCVVVVGAVGVLLGVVPGALLVVVVAALLVQAIVIAVLLRQRRRTVRRFVRVGGAVFAFAAPAPTSESDAERQSRERILALLDQLDERELRLLALSLLTRTDDAAD